jgi:hypothetical protein
MQNPLWSLIVSMLQFVVGGYNWRLLWKHVSMNLEIDLTFGIFVSNDGKVSWSIWTFHLWTSYDSFFVFVYSKLEFHLHLSSIYTPLPSVLPSLL